MKLEWKLFHAYIRVFLLFFLNSLLANYFNFQLNLLKTIGILPLTLGVFVLLWHTQGPSFIFFIIINYTFLVQNTISKIDFENKDSATNLVSESVNPKRISRKLICRDNNSLLF